MKYNEALDAAIGATMTAALRAAETLQPYNVPPGQALDLIIAGMTQAAAEQFGTYSDGRAATWRARLYLYDARSDQLLADSDAGEPIGQPGEARIKSLAGVAQWVAANATSYHDLPCVGLEESTLTRRIKSLRVQMSTRKDGSGTMRLPYTVNEAGRFGAPAELRHMLARCEIIRDPT